jgi:hypothetical protein
VLCGDHSTPEKESDIRAERISTSIYRSIPALSTAYYCAAGTGIDTSTLLVFVNDL